MTSLLITFSLLEMSRVPIIDGVETDFCKGSLACNKLVSVERFAITLLKPFCNNENLKKNIIYTYLHFSFIPDSQPH